LFGIEGRRQLDQDDVQFRGKRLDGMEEGSQLGFAIAQETFVGDRAGQFTGEPERRRRCLDPALDGGIGRNVIKRGIDFHRREITGVKFQPARRRQIGRIKAAAPLFKAPGAGAEPYFLLGQEIQGILKRNRIRFIGKPYGEKTAETGCEFLVPLT